MIIKRSPVFSECTLIVSRSRDILTLNGVSFDFTEIAEGDILPADAVNSPFVTSDVTRADGAITLTIRWPHGADADEAERHPEPYTPPNGPTGEAGQIDWSQRTTAADRAAEAAAQWRETATVYKRAMRQAMKFFPSASHNHMLEEIDVSVSALPDYHPAKDAWRDVSEFQRNHPDVAALAAPFGLTDSEIDALFVVAIALEGGATAQEALASAGIEA